MAAKKSTRAQKTIEITFVGGAYDGRVYEFANPCSEYLVMNLGRDLYKRESHDQYRYTEDWSQYKQKGNAI
jgi:hypothetical protein